MHEIKTGCATHTCSYIRDSCSKTFLPDGAIEKLTQLYLSATDISTN